MGEQKPIMSRWTLLMAIMVGRLLNRISTRMDVRVRKCQPPGFVLLTSLRVHRRDCGYAVVVRR